MKTTYFQAFLFGFFVCFFSSVDAALSADRVRVSYSALNATQSYLWTGQERGIFAKHGIDVESLYINSGSMNAAALIGGSVQVAGGGPVSIETRLRGLKLTMIAAPLPILASNLVALPEIKGVGDLKGKTGGISRFGSSTDQGFRYLFRRAGMNLDRDLKLLQLGADANRLAALQVNKIQYTFLGAAATEQARGMGYRVISTAQQMNIPFPWTTVVVDEGWLTSHRDLAYRYVKGVTEAIWFMKRNRAESERIIGKYMKLADPKLLGMEYDFYTGIFPDLPAPPIEGIRLVLENLGPQFPDAARRDPREFVDESIIERLRRERFLENLGR